MTDHSHIKGKTHMEQYEMLRFKPVNWFRRVIGKPPITHTAVVFTPTEPILLLPGEQVEFVFYETGQTEVRRMEVDDNGVE